MIISNQTNKRQSLSQSNTLPFHPFPSPLPSLFSFFSLIRLNLHILLLSFNMFLLRPFPFHSFLPISHVYFSLPFDMSPFHTFSFFLFHYLPPSFIPVCPYQFSFLSSLFFTFLLPSHLFSHTSPFLLSYFLLSSHSSLLSLPFLTCLFHLSVLPLPFFLSTFPF